MTSFSYIFCIELEESNGSPIGRWIEVTVRIAAKVIKKSHKQVQNINFSNSENQFILIYIFIY